MEQKQNSSANNKQVFRDYRLALYQEQLGTVDLEFEDERGLRISNVSVSHPNYSPGSRTRRGVTDREKKSYFPENEIDKTIDVT
jgi:hypothetical protein